MEDEEELSYKFRFLRKGEAKRRNDRNDHEHWYRVGDILDVEDSSDLIDIVHDLGLMDTREPQKMLARLHRVVHRQRHHLSLRGGEPEPRTGAQHIRSCNNNGGTTLSHSDMLLSMAVAQWDDARQQIHDLVDEIRNIGRGFSPNQFDHDFVLKACLMLGDSDSIRFKVENFRKSKIGTLQDQWDRIRRTITETVELASSFGYSGQKPHIVDTPCYRSPTFSTTVSYLPAPWTARRFVIG